VIEREDRGKSPLLKDRKMIGMSPEQEQQQRLAAAYASALQQEQAKIRQQWPNAETSSAARWVNYSSDYQVKRVVDFEHNRIEVSLSGIYDGNKLDFARLSEKVEKELQTTLSTTVAKALKEDPIHQALMAAAGVSGGEVSAELVLSELFESGAPTAGQIEKAAQTLMRNARIRYQALNAALASIPVQTGKKMTYVIPLPDNRIRRKVQQYRADVRANSRRFALNQDVILAIMHTESHFNPLARSHVPAFGLMQIVPGTAGKDATRKLFKAPKLLSPQYLYHPGRNIEVGAAYLHVLYYEYLKDIKNPESRLYYTIAAYNGGISNVARAFTGQASYNDAVDKINSMTPQQVLDRLVTKAPALETRQYLTKVLKRRSFYASM